MGVQVALGDRRYVLHVTFKDGWRQEMVVRGDCWGVPFTAVVDAYKEAELWTGLRGAESVWIYEEVLKVT